jgi:hypothetical protein
VIRCSLDDLCDKYWLALWRETLGDNAKQIPRLSFILFLRIEL